MPTMHLRCRLLDLLIGSLDFSCLSILLQPLGDSRIGVEGHLCVGMLTDPRLKVCVNCCITSRQDAGATSVLELSLQDFVAAISLSHVSVQCILILRLVVMSFSMSASIIIDLPIRCATPVPVCLSCHRAQGGEQEIFPLLKVY